MNTWYWSSWVVSIVVRSLWVVLRSLWVVVGRFEIVVDRCGSLWVVPAFSNCGHL